MKYFHQIIIIFLIQNIYAQQYVENDRKINLEDIENDNILSEKLANENDPLITQSTQHLRPPSILAINPYLTAHQSNGGIIYGGTQPTQDNEIHYTQQPIHDNQKYQHHHHHHPHQIQYFTQHHQSPELLAEQNYNQQVYGQPAAVHEHDSTYTYTTLASRQSLLKPIIPTVATYLQPHHHQQQQSEQPQQFLYLPHGRSLNHHHQHRPQEIQQVVGGIQYVTHPSTAPLLYTHDEQEIINEEKIPNEQIIYHHHHPQPQQIPGSGATYLQYIPYVTRGSNNGQYIIMAPIPAGYGQTTAVPKPLLSYSHSVTPQQVVQYDVPQVNNQAVGGIQYVTNNEIENVPESVQPHPHPVPISYTPDYTLPQRPSKLYRIQNTQHHQSNNNYLTTYPEQDDNDEEKSQYNQPEEEKQSETTKLSPHVQQEENQEENFMPIKQIIPYTPKTQDIQYATPSNSIRDEYNSDLEKSKQQQYAPQHPDELQQQVSSLPTSKPDKNNQYFTSNRFSSFQSTTAIPTISQRYYATQKHITGTIKSNEQQQQQQREHEHEHPTSSNKSWSNKVMPLQYQQYESRYTTATPISTKNTFTNQQQQQQQHGSLSTTDNNKIKSNTAAFRSPIPKYYIPTPKIIQSTHRSSTATIPITTNQQTHFTAKQQHQQPTQLHSTPSPIPLPKFIKTIQHNQQQQQQSINNNNDETNTQIFTNNRQPKSLLESYIPSWVVVENQNKERTQQQQQQHQQPNGINNNNNYNTITYPVSHNQVNGNHLKRSPTTTISPTKLIKI